MKYVDEFMLCHQCLFKFVCKLICSEARTGLGSIFCTTREINGATALHLLYC